MAYYRKIGSSATASNVIGTLSKDIAVPADAQDTISSISWSPVSDHLAAASWDGKVRIYNVTTAGVATGVSMLTVDSPVFDCDWAKDGTIVAAGGADKKLHLLDANSNQTMVLSGHDAPIRNVRFVDVPGQGTPIIATGSWDKTVKYWDLRQQNPLASVDCQERVYSMDSKVNLLVVATADLKVHLFDLKNPAAISRTMPSPLKHQTKVVTAFPDGKAYAIGSIEGRVAMEAVDEKDPDSIHFSFRCHRDTLAKMSKVFTINDISFHPKTHSVFTTAGSDGTYQFWDRVLRTRQKHYPKVGEAITSTAFNRDGTFFAYAAGYDWSKGCHANNEKIETRLMLHPVSEDDLKKK
ncbi:WD40 repeat-like protein [Annulohypoxylon nitens]|nr:WD40 repeat-like protein [Annulohypoxylon nitens]